MLAGRADPRAFSSCLLNSIVATGRALGPEVRRIVVAARAERGQLDRHQAILVRATARIARARIAGRATQPPATNAAPASEMAEDVTTPPMSSGRAPGRPAASDDRRGRQGPPGDRQRDDDRAARPPPGSRSRGCHLGEADRARRSSKPEGRVEARQVVDEPDRGARTPSSSRRRTSAGRRASSESR